MSAVDHFVYWLLNAGGECIYVGSSRDPERRWHEHYRRLGDEIVTHRVDGPFTRRDGLAKELAETKRLNPKYNGQMKALPNRFSSWDARAYNCPDQDVLIAAGNLIVERHLAKRRAS